jgi:hypothetical protein
MVGWEEQTRSIKTGQLGTGFLTLSGPRVIRQGQGFALLGSSHAHSSFVGFIPTLSPPVSRTCPGRSLSFVSKILLRSSPSLYHILHFLSPVRCRPVVNPQIPALSSSLHSV